MPVMSFRPFEGFAVHNRDSASQGSPDDRLTAPFAVRERRMRP